MLYVIRVHLFLILLAMAVVAGCGDDSKERSGEHKPKKDAAQEAERADREKAVETAKAGFDAAPKNVTACSELASAYIQLASPSTAHAEEEQSSVPADRDQSLDKAIDTLRRCETIDPNHVDVQRALASSLMATEQVKAAVPYLKAIATKSKGAERASAYYAWASAASQAGDRAGALKAWQQFVKLAPRNDPRLDEARRAIAALRGT
jgi:tetratricopeptide (TPR) repeat protein